MKIKNINVKSIFLPLRFITQSAFLYYAGSLVLFIVSSLTLKVAGGSITDDTLMTQLAWIISPFSPILTFLSSLIFFFHFDTWKKNNDIQFNNVVAFCFFLVLMVLLQVYIGAFLLMGAIKISYF